MLRWGPSCGSRSESGGLGLPLELTFDTPETDDLYQPYHYHSYAFMEAGEA